MKIRPRTVMLALALAAALAGAGMAIANAATATGQQSRTRVSGVASSGPRINWDSPLPGGKSSSMQMARADGRLPFSPTMPQFGIAPSLVQVSPDARAIAFVYHFPLGTAFPVDGRVSVLEYQTMVTEEQLKAVAANPPG